MSYLVLTDVHKRFGEFVAVESFTLSAERGEFVSFLGPSGCGKTTTLRMIAGFEQPTEGEILLAGQPIAGVPPYRRNVNTVFQHYALFPHLSVRDNVAYGPRSQKVPKAEAAARVTELLSVVRLEDLAERKPNQLSGGQQQRVALARALACYPSALLLDEPLGALDLKLRQVMQAELKRIQREVGITFIYVTHDQWEALTMSDRIAVMNGGRVEQIGPPDEVYDNPSSVFVAGFIGDANLVDAEVTTGSDAPNRSSGTASVIASVLGTMMPARTNGELGDRDATLVIRPDRIAVAPSRPEGPSVEVKITDVTFQGSTVRLTGDAPSGESVFAHPRRFSVDGLPRPGEVTWWTWEPDAALVVAGRRPSGDLEP